MRITELPAGWSVRVSEVAPGLGYPGGATQMQIINHKGEIQTMWDLIDQGVVSLWPFN